MTEELYSEYNSKKNNYIKNPTKANKEILDVIKNNILNSDDMYIRNKKDTYIPYPNKNDPNFINLITNKKEFNYNRNEFDLNTNPCGDDKKDNSFELANHQIFLKNFMNNKTPYKGLLLYHGVGTGKTCSAITIAENFKDIYGRNGKNGELDKRIIILVPNSNVESGWRRNIFDITKGSHQCTGNTYVDEFNENNPNLTEHSNNAIRINKMINKYYQFFGYREFSNKVNKIIRSKIKKPQKDLDANGIKAYKEYYEQQKKFILKQYFSNRMLIIDEVHNLRSESNNDSEESRLKKESLNMIYDIVENSQNLRLLLLSATPMFNEANEILWFLNILLKNDDRSEISEEELFPEGELNRELLINKSRGYISYLRGENPQSFPIRLYPCDIKKDTISMLCFDPRKEGIQKSGKPKICNLPYPEKNIFNTQLETKLQFCKLFLDVYNGPQKEKNIELLDGIQDQTKIVLNDQLRLRQFSNITYPNETINETFKKTKKSGRMMYSYIDSSNDFLQKDNLIDYSIKIHNILNCISESEGIIFIFSEYLDYGCIPIALALERLGFNRLNNNNILDEKCDAKKYIDENGRCVTGKTKYQANYILLSSSQELSFNKSKEIDSLRSDENKNGEIVKVVIGSSTVAEGLDFKRIREIHILEPWYNLSKIDQITGRGIRFCSHIDLPPEKRNVTVYLHAGYLKEKESIDFYLYKQAEKKAILMGNVENIMKENAIDCIINKDINHIKPSDVKKVIQYTSQIKSNGENISCEKKPYDKKYTKICSYLNKCEINCLIQDYENIPDNSTLRYELLQPLIDKISNFIESLFYINPYNVYSLNEILKNVYEHFGITDNDIKQNTQKYDEEIIYYTLYDIINKKKNIVNSSGINGYIICKENYFIFQPLHLNENIPLNDRNFISKKPQKTISAKEFYKDYEKITQEENIKIDFKNMFDIIDLSNKKHKSDKFNNYILFKTIINEQSKEIKDYLLGKEIKYILNGKTKSIFKNELYYIIDNLYEGENENGSKHVFYRDFINNYKNKNYDDLIKNIRKNIKLNLVYIEDDNYILLNNKINKEPIGYLIMNNDNKLGDKTKEIIKFYDIYISHYKINVSKKVFSYLIDDPKIKIINIRYIDIKSLKTNIPVEDKEIFDELYKYYINSKNKDILLYVTDSEKDFTIVGKIFEKVKNEQKKQIFKFNGIEQVIDDDSKIPKQLNHLLHIKKENYHCFTFKNINEMVLKFIDLKNDVRMVLQDSSKGILTDLINEISDKKIIFDSKFSKKVLSIIIEIILKKENLYIRNDLYRLMNFKRDTKK